MKILFVNCRFQLFDSIYCGASTRSTLFLRALSQLGHVDVITFRCGQTVTNIKDCEVIFSKDIKSPVVKKRKAFEFVCKWCSLLFRPYNIRNFYSTDKERERVVDYYCNQNSYDLIACRYIDEAIDCGLLKYSDKLILDVDDNPVNALRRDLAMSHFHHVWGKWEMSIRLALLGKVVERILKKVRLSFYSNILESPSPKSVFLHNATTITDKIEDISETTPLRLVTVGFLDYYPNKIGILHFVEKVFPLVKAAVPNAELHIIGKSEDDKLISKLNSINGVKALGFVEDIISEYENSRVIIVPVYQGAGTSVKFVEGLFMNRPIVSTAMGVRGFEDLCVDGKHYMMAQTDQEFAKKVVCLLGSAALSKEIAHNAHEVGIAYFSIERFMEIVRISIMK